MKYSDETIGVILGKLGFEDRATDEEIVRETLEALESADEQKALRADAERYRWLRLHGYKDRIAKNDCVIFGRGIDQTMPELLDDYLDKAREA